MFLAEDNEPTDGTETAEESESEKDLYRQLANTMRRNVDQRSMSELERRLSRNNRAGSFFVSGYKWFQRLN